MLSVIYFKLIGVFLAGLYLSQAGVSATPTAVSPDTQALVPRVVPQDLCTTRDKWLYRACNPAAGLTAWEDACWSLHTAFQHQYQRGANCPGNTYCENIHDGEDFTIKCVNRQLPDTSAAVTSATDPQIGSSPNFEAVADDLQLSFNVKILNSVKASVAAFIVSKDREFALTPNKVIVGKIRGREMTVCKGDGSDVLKARVCYPTGRFPLYKGDHIDFTWGMTTTQVGSLAYTIWPSK